MRLYYSNLDSFLFNLKIYLYNRTFVFEFFNPFLLLYWDKGESKKALMSKDLLYVRSNDGSVKIFFA